MDTQLAVDQAIAFDQSITTCSRIRQLIGEEVATARSNLATSLFHPLHPASQKFDNKLGHRAELLYFLRRSNLVMHHTGHGHVRLGYRAELLFAPK